jgi:hypothetical protein
VLPGAVGPALTSVTGSSHGVHTVAATLFFLSATHPFTLALIAHDGKKDDMLRFAREHLDELRGLSLIATATTGSLLRNELRLDIETTASGPQGGDLQIGGRVVEGRIDGVISSETRSPRTRTSPTSRPF